MRLGKAIIIGAIPFALLFVIGIGWFCPVFGRPRDVYESSTITNNTINNIPIIKSTKKKVLGKNLVKGVNTLTQEMISDSNTTYIIKYKYVLGSDILIPSNCELVFSGGLISEKGNNDAIIGQNTSIIAGVTRIFNGGVSLLGSWNAVEAYPEWFGAVADGRTDDTAPIQKTINIFRNIHFKGTTYAHLGISPKSNTTITYSYNCYIKAAGILRHWDPQRGAEKMIDIRNVENVTIYGNNAVIDGGRKDYPIEEGLGNGNDERHSLCIRGSHNVEVNNLQCNNSFGDGITLGAPYGGNNKNIKLVGCKADNNSRQGLSIVDGEDIYVDNCVFTNTHGSYAGPWAGIDIEPNYLDGYVLNNVNIINCKSKNNAGAGLLIAASLKSEERNKNVNIHVDHFVSESDLCGISLQNYTLFDCVGRISFSNIKVSGQRFLHFGRWGGNKAILTSFSDCEFIKSMTIGAENAIYNSVIIADPPTNAYNNYIGDIHIDGLKVRRVTEEKITAIIAFRANQSQDKSIKILRNFKVRGIDIGDDNQYDYYNLYGPVQSPITFDRYEDVFIDFTHPVPVSGLSKYTCPIVSNYGLIKGGNFELSKFKALQGTKVRFTILGEGIQNHIFTINEDTPIYNRKGRKLRRLFIEDAQSKIRGGRKAAIGAYITFVAKPQGWYIDEVSPIMEALIREIKDSNKKRR